MHRATVTWTRALVLGASLMATQAWSGAAAQAPPEAPDPGTDPGPDPGPDPGSDPGPDPGTEPASESGTDPGSDPGPAPESDPGPAPESGSGSGTASGSGTESGTGSASESGTESGSEPGPASAPAAAPAPTPAPAAPPPEPEEEEIVVTGSRIKRTSFAASAPVQVIGQQEIEYSGATNLADVVRYMSANGSSNLLGRDLAAQGSTSVNLRGLGSQATLVLINGRRFMPSGGGVAGVFYDMNTIPVAAVERIEVLRGGASSIYGSDAIAGVVNIITKRDWSGATAEIGGTTTDDLDHSERDMSLAFGARQGPVKASVGVAYTYRDELLASERDWTAGTVELLAGNPANFFVPGEGLIPDPDCNMSVGTQLDEEANNCVYDFGRQSTLVGERELLSLYSYGEYAVTDHTALFTELGYTRMRTQNTTTPSLPVLARTLIPEDHPDNPFGREVFFVGQVNPQEVGARKNGFGDDTVRAVFGIKGDFEDVALGSFAEDWEWELSGSWSASRYHGWLPIETIAENLQEAINSCGDPADLSRCFNPFYSAHTGEGTPNSQEVIDWIMGRLIWSTESKLTTADAGLTGSLFELPGGDAAFAVGAQYRLEERLTQGDHDAEQLAYSFFFGFTSAEGRQDIVSGYLELLWPLLDGLEVQTAGRAEDHENSGNNFSPSVGVLVVPVELAGEKPDDGVFDRLRLRAHLTRAFRAPSLYQTFPGFAASVGQFTENGVMLFRPVIGYGNPDAEPEEAIAFSTGLDWSPVKQLSLTLDYWRYDYDNRVMGQNAQQIFRADPNDPRVLRDDMGNLTGVEIMVVNVGEVTTQGLDFGAMVELDLGGEDSFAFGGDGTLVLEYEVPRSAVTGQLLADGSEGIVADCTGDDPDDTCDVVGGRNATNLAGPIPRMKLNVPVTLEIDGHAVAAIAHLITGLKDDQNGDPDTGEFPDIDPFVTFDLQYAYTIEDWVGDSTVLRLGVLNLLDSDPPVVQTPWGYLSGLHDPRGRMLYARLEQNF